MVAFELPTGTDPAKLRTFLWDRKIEIPVIERSDRLLTRVSCHCYTIEVEIDRWAEGMKDWLSK